MYRNNVGKITLLSLLLCLCFSSISYGGTIPQIINYQGTLTDTSGSPVPDGQYGVVFNIYDVPTGGTPLWTEIWNNTTVPVSTIKGIFNVLLGANNTIPLSFFNDHTVTYLGIKVGNDSEMAPRQRISSVAYAFTAGSGGVPKGAIIMWSGAIDQIPEGWALCDGNNGTPDLRDRFVVGAGSGYAVGATGGEAMHTLTIAEMPSHTHIQNAHTHDLIGWCINHSAVACDNGWAGGSTWTKSGVISSITATNQNTGGGAAHNNLPPYYALAFIMKL
jgi:microcystin-dependent protein